MPVLLCLVLFAVPPTEDILKLAIVDFDVASFNKKAKHHYKSQQNQKKQEELAIAQVVMGELERELQVEFDIVERRKLKTVLNEHKIATTGPLNGGEAKEVWRILKADRLLTGTITEYQRREKHFKSKRYKIDRMTYTYHLAASFKLIESHSGAVLVVATVAVRTDSRELRQHDLDDTSFRSFLCQKLALGMRERLVRDLRARQEE